MFPTQNFKLMFLIDVIARSRDQASAASSSERSRFERGGHQLTRTRTEVETRDLGHQEVGGCFMFLQENE